MPIPPRGRAVDSDRTHDRRLRPRQRANCQCPESRAGHRCPGGRSQHPECGRSPNCRSFGSDTLRTRAGVQRHRRRQGVRVARPLHAGSSQQDRKRTHRLQLPARIGQRRRGPLHGRRRQRVVRPFARQPLALGGMQDGSSLPEVMLRPSCVRSHESAGAGARGARKPAIHAPSATFSKSFWRARESADRLRFDAPAVSQPCAPQRRYVGFTGGASPTLTYALARPSRRRDTSAESRRCSPWPSAARASATPSRRRRCWRPRDCGTTCGSRG